MKEHPAESQRELAPGIVTRVYPDTWEVDVRPLYATSGTVRRAKVIGHYLPEVHTEERQSKVIYGRLDATQQAPVAIPIHNTMIPDADKPNYVHWLQLLGFRFTINRTGELEIRHSDGDDVLVSFRIHDRNLTVDAAENVTINCKNADVNVAEKAVVTCGTEADVEAPVIKLGSSAAAAVERAVLGEQLTAYLGILIATFNTHIHGGVEGGNSTTGVPTEEGFTQVALPPTALSAITKLE